MGTADVSVLFVGSGIVSMTTALFLLQQEISAEDICIIELSPGISVHPRARGNHARTMELYRVLGLAKKVTQVGAALNSKGGGMTWGPTLAAYVAARNSAAPLGKYFKIGGMLLVILFILSMLFTFVSWIVSALAVVVGFALSFLLILILLVTGFLLLTRRLLESLNMAERFTFCTQDVLEPVLFERLKEQNVHPHFETELKDLKQQEDGVVEATVIDRKTGISRIIRARYVIGCDGSRSTVRQLQGILWEGSRINGQQLNLFFHCNLLPLIGEKNLFSLCNLKNASLPRGRAIIGSINNSDKWVIHICISNDRQASDFSEEECVSMIRTAIGCDVPPITLLGKMTWRSHVRLASTYRSGNIFLAGDAAHTNPPWGGFGATTGIADGHNLAWKLAAVLNGQARSLLDTYEVERRPVARFGGAIAGSFNDEVGLLPYGFRLVLQAPRAAFYAPNLLGMGYGYTSAAIVSESGQENAGPGTTNLNGMPGTRVPNVRLVQPFHPAIKFLDAADVCTIDVCKGKGLTLLAGPNADAIISAVQTAAQAHKIEVKVFQAGKDIHYQSPSPLFALLTLQRPFSQQPYWPGSFRTARKGALLVRPDGIVGARYNPKHESRSATQWADLCIKQIYQ